MIEVTIGDVADLIREMTPEQRADLVEELARPRHSRCPARPKGQCVRDEDHALPHVDADGNESIVALRCRIGVTSGPAICAKLDRHEGPCNPLPGPVMAYVPPSESRSAPRPWGLCQCGAGRKEHERGIGPAAATGCAKYKSARTHGAAR